MDGKLAGSSIYCFLITPEMKGKGIAKHLLEYACQDAAENGFDYVEAYPWKEALDERLFLWDSWTCIKIWDLTFVERPGTNW